MSYCLNPYCSHPQNWQATTLPCPEQVCQTCGSRLLLRNHYRAIRPLAQGSFGRTFLAVDEDRLGTPCVIKQFWPQVRGQTALEKATELFNREAKQLLRLGEHPQIPSLLASVTQDDHLYLVQEFIDGQNLTQELQTHGAFSETQIRELLIDLLPVLEFVHQHGVIHRDIKPDNILRRLPATREPWRSTHRLVLVDFGVAKQTSQLTGTGTLTGTIGYAPIEQIRGGKSYPASDLYSLGVTCVHLLTNVSPDQLFDPITGQLVWQSHLPPKNQSISSHLTQILNQLLSDFVRERYQSATEVLQALMEVTPAPIPPATTHHFPDPPAIIHSQLDIIVEAELEALRTQLTQLQAQHPELPILNSIHGSTTLPATCNHHPPSTTRQSSELRQPAPSSRDQPHWHCLQTLKAHQSATTAFIYTTAPISTYPPPGLSNSSRLITSSEDKTIKLWEPLTGRLLASFTGHIAPVNTLAITPDHRTLISGSADRTILAWNLRTGTLMDRFYSYSGSPYSHRGGAVNTLAISPDGRTVISGSADMTLKLWNQRNGELLYRLPGHRGAVLSVAYAVPDVSPEITDPIQTHHLQCWIFASGSADRTIKIWRVGTSESLRTLTGHQGAVHCLVFSPDGHTLISGSSDTIINLWNFHTGELLTTLTGHQHPVLSLAISPDGKLLASATEESVKIWHLSQPRELITLEGNAPVTFSPDGGFLVTGSKKGRVLVWQPASGTPVISAIH